MPTSILKPPLFNPPPPIQSSLLRKAPDSIPPTPELEQLHDELQELKKISLARAKKAGDDLKAIEESMRRMKEKEKGKARAVVKRERDCTCLSFGRVTWLFLTFYLLSPLSVPEIVISHVVLYQCLRAISDVIQQTRLYQMSTILNL